NGLLRLDGRSLYISRSQIDGSRRSVVQQTTAGWRRCLGLRHDSRDVDRVNYNVGQLGRGQHLTRLKVAAIVSGFANEQHHLAPAVRPFTQKADTFGGSIVQPTGCIARLDFSQGHRKLVGIRSEISQGYDTRIEF